MVAAIAAEVPAYRLLPSDALRDDVVPIVRRNLEAFATVLDKGGEPGDEIISDVEASATRRAEEGFPLDAVIAAYHIGAREAWNVVADLLCRRGEAASLPEVGRALITYIGAVTTAVASVYLDRHGHLVAAERELRRSLAHSVLAGQGDLSLLAELGAAEPDRYGVLVLGFDEPGGPVAAGLTGLVAGRRLVRRVETALPTLAGPRTLHLLDATGGCVLVDVRDRPDWPEGSADLAASVAEAAGVAVWAAAGGPCVLADVAGTCEEGRAVVDLARRLGRPPGLYGSKDLLLEAMADSHHSALAELLRPLDGRNELLATLETWFDCDRDRQRAARALFIHPNTLDYRLQQVADRTGIDPRSTRGAALLMAACVARGLSARPERESRRL